MAIATVEEAIRYTLINNSGVKAITTRVYPSTLPQNPTYPLVLYFRVTGSSDVALGGATGLQHPRFQIEAWADTYAAAKTLAKAIRAALNCQKFTVDSIRVGSIVIQSERDYYEPDAAMHRIIMDFMVWSTE